MISSVEQAMARLGVKSSALAPEQKNSLDVEGYVMLRGVLSAAQCETIIAAFERHYVPSHLSQPPRSGDSRHALLNDEPEVCRACLAPLLLASAHHLLRRRFYLHDVQGRDPIPGRGYQPIHRDWTEPEGPAPIAIALAFLEPFGPENGATRVLPRTQRIPGGANAFSDIPENHPDQVVVVGGAGDVLVMDGYLGHSGTRNVTDSTRRNLQIDYRGHEFYRLGEEKRDLTVYSPQERYLMGEEN